MSNGLQRRIKALTASESQRQSIRNRLAARSEPRPGGCLYWRGATSGMGYGRISVGNRILYTHRAAWLAEHGELPAETLILHSCDNPPCVAIGHLRLGDAADNSADCQARGRAWRPLGLGAAKRGSANHNSKLSADQVQTIRQRVAAGETRAAVARDYGVARQTVSDIAAGKFWACRPGV